MRPVRISATIDPSHRLSAQVPAEIPPGPVTVLIAPQGDEDDAGDAWAEAVAHEWAEDLEDPRQDLYTLADGEPERSAPAKSTLPVLRSGAAPA